MLRKLIAQKQVRAQVRVQIGEFQSEQINDEASFMVWITRKDKHATGTAVCYPQSGRVKFEETLTFRMTLFQHVSRPGIFAPKPFTLQVCASLLFFCSSPPHFARATAMTSFHHCRPYRSFTMIPRTKLLESASANVA